MLYKPFRADRLMEAVEQALRMLRPPLQAGSHHQRRVPSQSQVSIQNTGSGPSASPPANPSSESCVGDFATTQSAPANPLNDQNHEALDSPTIENSHA